MRDRVTNSRGMGWTPHGGGKQKGHTQFYEFQKHLNFELQLLILWLIKQQTACQGVQKSPHSSFTTSYPTIQTPSLHWDSERPCKNFQLLSLPCFLAKFRTSIFTQRQNFMYTTSGSFFISPDVDVCTGNTFVRRNSLWNFVMCHFLLTMAFLNSIYHHRRSQLGLNLVWSNRSNYLKSRCMMYSTLLTYFCTHSVQIAYICRLDCVIVWMKYWL